MWLFLSWIFFKGVNEAAKNEGREINPFLTAYERGEITFEEWIGD